MNLFNYLFHKPITTIAFLYSPEFKDGGGTIMRGYQLSQITKRQLGHKYKIIYSSSKVSHKNSILYLTKMAIATSTPIDLNNMLQRGNILIFDPNDSKIPDEKIKYAHAVVAASRTAYDAYKERYPQKNVTFIDHHVDPRIKPLRGTKSIKEFRAGYFGELNNTVISDEIKKYVDFIHVDTSSQANLDWIKEIPKYNFHYAIRKKQDFDGFKPATKVFTAAHCNANILIQNSESEAIKWLGNDYPYILKGSVNETSIVSALKKAKQSYGSDDWYLGLEKMASIKHQISEKVIGGQVGDMIDKLITGWQR